VVRRLVGERSRAVCPVCRHVHYENPLPVASAVVLDEDRRLLCIRRGNEPLRGEWCLPIGFAELGETIEQACLRELREEAGLEGRVLRLLGASTQESDFYGDLLVVSFLVQPMGGEIRAGDDAVEVGWFPLDAHPPLAFSANDAALAALRPGRG
jgi:ADP-ribose pyrophosphatase YjhB (NUDIX family)